MGDQVYFSRCQRGKPFLSYIGSVLDQKAFLGLIALQESETRDAASYQHVFHLQVSRIADSENGVMLMLGRCLPHIVPNVLLAKREVIYI